MKINLLAPINQLGYGIASVNILTGLMLNKNEVALFNLNGNQAEAHPKYHKFIYEAANNAEIFSRSSPTLKVWHQNDLAITIGKGTQSAFPFFELNKFSEREKYHLSNAVDIVFTASQWGKKVLLENNIKAQLVVAPLGVDRKCFNEKIVVDNEISKDERTKFISIGKWEIRKGHDILAEAFRKAFTPEDKVMLIMNCFSPFPDRDGKEVNTQWTQFYGEALGDQVSIFPRRLQSQDEVAALLRSVDCGVFPSRAEGWNLELLEMMSCGKHVIATDYSAHTEFVNNENAKLIKIKNLEPAFDNIFFDGKIGEWAAIEEDQIEQLVVHMRSVHALKQEGKLGVNTSGIETAERFSWNDTAILIADTLK